jgi:metal-dependent amidase/aminoacylase/carboxypeptidase family protein
METRNSRAAVARETGVNRRQSRELTLKVHANSEPGLQEVGASGRLTQYLEENGTSGSR